MAETVEIQMPQMGESVTEGTVLEWHKQEGEFVSEGETVVEVSTDKIDAEVPAPASGVITRIVKGPDETIEVGGVLAELDPSADLSADGAASGNGAATSADGGDREPGPGLTAGATGEGDADLGEESAPSEAPEPGVTKTVMLMSRQNTLGPVSQTCTVKLPWPEAWLGASMRIVSPLTRRMSPDAWWKNSPSWCQW